MGGTNIASHFRHEVQFYHTAMKNLGQSFPTDIFESILRYSSHSTLLTTSAVNRTFHLITRKYLFSLISLKSTAYDRDTVSRARTFLSLLDHIPDISNFVRRIHIDCSGENLLELSDDLSDTAPLIAVLSRLPRLNSISLRGRDPTTSNLSWLDWTTISIKLRQAFTRTFRSSLICEIKLSHIYNFSLSTFVQCRSLEHLSFNMVSSNESMLSHQDLEFRPKLKSLVLRNSFTFYDDDDEANLRWLSSLQGLFDVSQLSEFVFSAGHSHMQPARILSLCAESIKSLELRMNTKGRFA